MRYQGQMGSILLALSINMMVVGSYKPISLSCLCIINNCSIVHAEGFIFSYKFLLIEVTHL
jgi:hypothetical protein